MSKAPAIGIDLGTTYSCVGVWQNGKVDIVPNDMGERTTPSYVAFTDTERLVGDAAKNQITRNPTNTVFDAKRLIGRKYEDREVQDDMKLWPFKIVEDPQSDRPQVQITYQKQERIDLVQDRYAYIIAYLLCTAKESLLWSDLTENIKELYLSSINGKKLSDSRIKKQVIDYISNYTTLEELENLEKENYKVLNKFIKR